MLLSHDNYEEAPERLCNFWYCIYLNFFSFFLLFFVFVDFLFCFVCVLFCFVLFCFDLLFFRRLNKVILQRFRICLFLTNFLISLVFG